MSYRHEQIRRHTDPAWYFGPDYETEHEERCRGLPRFLHAMPCDPVVNVSTEVEPGATFADRIQVYDYESRELSTHVEPHGAFQWADPIAVDQNVLGWLLTTSLGLVDVSNAPNLLSLRDRIGFKVITELLTEPGPWTISGSDIAELWHEILNERFAGWDCPS